MTCIVGIKHFDRVWIGGDRLSSDGYAKEYSLRSKVFYNEEYIIGYTSSFRMGDLLEHVLEPPEYDGSDPHRFMVREFVPRVIKTFKDNYWFTDGKAHGGEFLLAFRDNLFKVQDDFSVQSFNETATGSGQIAALGSLHSTDGDPCDRIRAAIKAADHNIVTVGGEIDILRTQ